MPHPNPFVPDLTGDWITDQGEGIVIQQSGSTVNAHFRDRQPCPSGGARANLLVGANLAGPNLSGPSSYIACALSPPQALQVCGVRSVHATEFKATVSEDGATITGEWLADGFEVTYSGGLVATCRPNSRYDKWTGFTLTRCGGQALDLSSTDSFRINTEPKMPELKAEVSPVNAAASWEAQITFSNVSVNCSGGPNFDSAKLSGSGASFSPSFSGLYGGKLDVKVKTACGERTETRQILGDDPGKPAIQAELGTIDSPFDSDDLKRIACQESRQMQFLANGEPQIGDTGDFGIMQICYQRTSVYLWDWKENIQRGRAILQSALAFARGVPRMVRQREVRGMGPFEEATDFSDDELRMEAIKRYNAGNVPERGYWQWDPALEQWVANPQGGIPAYADEVVGQTPTCP